MKTDVIESLKKINDFMWEVKFQKERYPRKTKDPNSSNYGIGDFVNYDIVQEGQYKNVIFHGKLAQTASTHEAYSSQGKPQTQSPIVPDWIGQASYAMSYAKDLVVADKIQLSEMTQYAKWFAEFMTTGEVGHDPTREPREHTQMEAF